MPSRPLSSGRLTTMRRSKRPGRRSAGSRTSGRFVAATRMTPSLLSKPSISTRSWLSVCSRSSRAAPVSCATMAADRVDLVDEDDARRVLLALLEEVAHARRADADEHLDEVGAADREEGNVGFPRDGAREQRLARSRRAHEEHALRNAAAEFLELLRFLE